MRFTRNIAKDVKPFVDASGQLKGSLGGKVARQLKAVGVLVSGGSYRKAARAAGTSHEMISRWLADDVDFRAEYNRQMSMVRQTLVGQITALGSLSVEELVLQLAGRSAGRRLVAAKAGLTAAVAIVKPTAEAADGVRVAPLFALPAGTVVSLDIEVGAMPATPAAVVVDAELAEAAALPVNQLPTPVPATGTDD